MEHYFEFAANGQEFAVVTGIGAEIAHQLDVSAKNLQCGETIVRLNKIIKAVCEELKALDDSILWFKYRGGKVDNIVELRELQFRQLVCFKQELENCISVVKTLTKSRCTTYSFSIETGEIFVKC